MKTENRPERIRVQFFVDEEFNPELYNLFVNTPLGKRPRKVIQLLTKALSKDEFSTPTIQPTLTETIINKTDTSANANIEEKSEKGDGLKAKNEEIKQPDPVEHHTQPKTVEMVEKKVSPAITTNRDGNKSYELFNDNEEERENKPKSPTMQWILDNN